MALKVCFGSAAAASGPLLASLGLLGPLLFLLLAVAEALLHGACCQACAASLLRGRPLLHGVGCQACAISPLCAEWWALRRWAASSTLSKVRASALLLRWRR